MSRFSKQSLTEELQKSIDAIQSEWGFDITNGTVQIEPVARDRVRTNPLTDGLGRECDRDYHVREAWLDYGRLQALHDIACSFELAVSYVPATHGTRRKLGRLGNNIIRYASDAQVQRGIDRVRQGGQP